MSVTEKLLRVYLVDKQLRGLQSRLGGAEKFLADQVGQLGQLEASRKSLETEIKQSKVRRGDLEGEVARLDARLATLREQMDKAQTNKEYKAFLTEVNTVKAERDRLETQALEHLAKSDETTKKLDELDSKRKERESVKQVAASDRDQRHAEIRDRLAELKAERDKVAADVPGDVLSAFNRLIAQRGDDAMAPVEIHDFKRHEFTCGACMIALPLDLVSGLISSGRLTKCVSCQCILYLDDAAKEAASPSPKGSTKSGSKAAKGPKGGDKKEKAKAT